MIRSLCLGLAASLSFVIPSQATVLYSGKFDAGGGDTYYDGNLAGIYGAGKYTYRVVATTPISLGGEVNGTYHYTSYCNYGNGEVPCGGNDVPGDEAAFIQVSPTVYQAGPITTYGLPTDAFSQSCCQVYFSFGAPLAGSYTLSIFAGTPEPEAWALMILGFGVIGSAMRKQRQTLRYNFSPLSA